MTMRPLPTTTSCFGCGSENTAGLQLSFLTDGHEVHSHFSFRPEHAGFKSVVHGGILATVLDEAMAWACGVQTRRFAYCAELNVRFHRPARSQVKYVVTGRVSQNRKNRLITAEAVITEDGVPVASSTGKYIPLDEETEREALSDIKGGLAALWPDEAS